MEGEFPVPDSLPAISALRRDRMGNLWVARRGLDPRVQETFDVFGPDGRWLTSVFVPEALGYITELGGDYVLAIWYDELGVPFLREYRLEKPGEWSGGA